MIDFLRYLAANKTVDYCTLNRLVWEQLKSALLIWQPDQRQR
jgi:hypothetical protein